MSNYKETTVSGEAWQRCHHLSIRNELNQNPVFEFCEEKAIALEGDTIKKEIGILSVPFDAADEFDILDPTTGLPTGQKSTQAQLQLLLTCFYLARANKRDIEQQEAQATTEE